LKRKTIAAIFIQKIDFATDAISKKELLMQLEEKSFATAAVRYQYIATVILNSLNTFE